MPFFSPYMTEEKFRFDIYRHLLMVNIYKFKPFIRLPSSLQNKQGQAPAYIPEQWKRAGNPNKAQKIFIKGIN